MCTALGKTRFCEFVEDVGFEVFRNTLYEGANLICLTGSGRGGIRGHRRSRGSVGDANARGLEGVVLSL